MSYTVYILYSPSCDQFYVGQTSDLNERLFRHNNPGSKSTKKTNDWIVKYAEDYSTKSDAAARELQIKKKKSRKYIEWLIAKQVKSQISVYMRLPSEKRSSRTLSGE
jgi:predicted GIY-YIG superfamily endonuclease